MSKKHDDNSISYSGFFSSSMFIYITMLSVGALVSYFFNENLLSSLSISEDVPLSELLVLGFLAGSVLTIASNLFEMEFAEYRVIKNYLLEVIGQAPTYWIVCLSLMSAAGEEVFFRAALQPELGILGTAFVFALLHLGPKNLPNSWTLMSIIISLLLGVIYKYTNSIIPVFLAHLIMNLTSMFKLRYRYRKLMKEVASEPETEVKDLST